LLLVSAGTWNSSSITVRDSTLTSAGPVHPQPVAARGGLERAAHGVYRFPQLPVTERDPYMLAVLWAGADRTFLTPVFSP
jgi:predicted transcriptional regulator of viral defense system